MNILKRELRAGLKPFLFWSLGIFVLIFAGITKYTGISTGGDAMKQVVDSMPRVVMALIGCVGLDITTLGGYYGILTFFSIICASIYGVYLGGNAVSREAVDKTYEFVFTKPRARTYILGMKLAAAWIFYTMFCLLNYVFSISGIALLKMESDLNSQMVLFAVAIYLCGLIFVGFSAMFAAAVKEAEKGSRYANRTVMIAFGLGIVIDMLDHPGILRIFSPFRYFPAPRLLENHLDTGYVLLAILLWAGSLLVAVRCFEKKDLNAV